MSSNNYAGFWLRFVAYIIDSIIVQTVLFVIILPILGLFGMGFSTMDFSNISDEDSVAMITAMVGAMSTFGTVSFVLGILYYAILESSNYQATFGKLALGLQVTDMEGHKIDFVKALIRQIGKIVSGIIFLIGYIMAGFTEKKQALHDLIASTLVVKK